MHINKFEVKGLRLAAAGQWGLAKLPCSEHAVPVEKKNTVMIQRKDMGTKYRTRANKGRGFYSKIIFLTLHIGMFYHFLEHMPTNQC